MIKITCDKCERDIALSEFSMWEQLKTTPLICIDCSSAISQQIQDEKVKYEAKVVELKKELCGIVDEPITEPVKPIEPIIDEEKPLEEVLIGAKKRKYVKR